MRVKPAMAFRNSRLFAALLALYVPSVVSDGGFASSSAPSASITSAPSYSGASGSCSKFCGYAPVWYSSKYWSQWITPVTVGTVLVIVDDTNDKTTTTTSYGTGDAVVGTATVPISDLINSGLLPTASTTMTAEATGFDGSATIVTYPDNWWTIDSEISWAGTIPYTTAGTSKCSSWGAIAATGSSVYYPFSLQPSPLPTFVASTVPGKVNSDDPYGNLYTLQDYYEKEALSREDIATLFPDDGFLLDIYGCSSPTVPAAATAVQTVAALLATTTQHVTDAPTTKPATSEKPTSPERQSPTLRTTISVTGGRSTQPLSIPSPTLSPSPSPSPSSCTNVGCFVGTQLGGHQTKVPPTEPEGTTLVADGQTLVPGKTAVISGTTYSLPTTGSAIIANGQTLATTNALFTTQTSAGSTTEYLIGSQTLVPGGTVVVSGSTFSLPSSESGIYINGESTAIPTNAAGTPFSLGSVGVTPTDTPASPSYSGPAALSNSADRGSFSRPLCVSLLVAASLLVLG